MRPRFVTATKPHCPIQHSLLNGKTRCQRTDFQAPRPNYHGIFSLLCPPFVAAAKPHCSIQRLLLNSKTRWQQSCLRAAAGAPRLRYRPDRRRGKKVQAPTCGHPARRSLGSSEAAMAKAEARARGRRRGCRRQQAKSTDGDSKASPGERRQAIKPPTNGDGAHALKREAVGRTPPATGLGSHEGRQGKP